MNGNKALTADLQEAKLLAVNRLLRPNSFNGVVGVGIGYKLVDNQVTRTQCVRVYVETKLEQDDLTRASLIPSSFLEFPTDVIQVGRFGRFPSFAKDILEPAAQDLIGPGSPITVKTDAPNVNLGAVGTLGAVIARGTDRFILSCNHVLAANGRVPANAQIVSAAPVDVGTQPQVIAAPGPFIPIARSQSKLCGFCSRSSRAARCCRGEIPGRDRRTTVSRLRC